MVVTDNMRKVDTEVADQANEFGDDTQRSRQCPRRPRAAIDRSPMRWQSDSAGVLGDTRLRAVLGAMELVPTEEGHRPFPARLPGRWAVPSPRRPMITECGAGETCHGPLNTF